MTEARRWARHALTIGWVEFRRTLRAIRTDSARAVLLGISVMGTGLVSLVAAVAFVVFVDTSSGAIAITDQIAGSFALFWGFGVFIVAQRTAAQHDRIDAEALLLTTVAPRTVAVGLLVAETLRMLSYLLLPAVGATIVAVDVLGSPVTALVVPVTLVCLSFTIVVVGGLVGWVAALAVARYRFVARQKTPLSIVAAVAVIGPYFAFQTGVVEGLSPDVLAVLPVAWFVHLATVGTPSTSPVLAAGSLVLTAVILGPGGLLTTGTAMTYWKTDPVDPTPDEETSTAEAGTGDALGRALGRFDLPRWPSRPALAVARKAVVRTRRNPGRLSFILVPAFVGGAQLITFWQSTGTLQFLPQVFVVGAAWLAGAAFGLNPLGDEGTVLDATLTAGIEPPEFVRGVAYPGALVGVPLVVVGPVATGLVVGTPPWRLAGLVGLGIALTAFALSLAPAVGMRFPRFSAISAGRAREAVPPTLTTVAVYTVPLAVVAAIGVGALSAADPVADVFVLLFGVAVPAPVVGAVGYSSALALSVAGGWLAYRDAASTFATYRPH